MQIKPRHAWLTIFIALTQIFCWANNQSNPGVENCQITSAVADKTIVCINEEVTFTVNTKPAKCKITWSGGGTPASGTEGPGNPKVFKTKWSKGGKKTVVIKCDDDEKKIDIEVVEVDSLTVINVNDTTCKATNPSDSELVIWENLTLDTKIKLQASGKPSTATARKCILWKVEGSKATPSSGNFGGADPIVTLIPTGSPKNRIFPVNVGCDQNKNGTLEKSEVTHTITVYVPLAKLKSVEFKDDNDISDDDGNVYSGVDWEDADLDGTAETKQPVAYVRKETMNVTTKWDLGVAITDISKVKVRAIWEHPSDPSKNQKLAHPGGTAAGLSVSGKILTLAKTAFDTALEDYVGLFDKLDLKWEVTCDGGTTWMETGESENIVYCTWDEPILTESRLFHTVIHIGCANANGISGTDEVKVFNKIWDEFSDRVVSRVDPKTCKMDRDPKGMIYWKVGSRVCRSVTAFLKIGHTSCGTWATFFRSCAYAQGITNHTREVVQAPNVVNRGKLIIDYKAQFSITGNVYWEYGSSNNFPAGGLSTGDKVLTLISDNSTLGGLTQTDGVFFVKSVDFGGKEILAKPAGFAGFPGSSSEAQGNKNAKAWFGNHAIVKFNNKFYDPSYGGIFYDTFVKWEEASLQAYGALFRVKTKALIGFTTVGDYLWKERDNSAGEQTKHATF